MHIPLGPSPVKTVSTIDKNDETILLYVHRSEVAYQGRGQGGRKRESDTALKRPERPWTAARTMELFKAVSPCHCAATSALRNCCFKCRAWAYIVTETMSVALLLPEEQPEAKEVQLSQPSSTSLLMISSGLRVQLHLPPLDLAWNPGTSSKKVYLYSG